MLAGMLRPGLAALVVVSIACVPALPGGSGGGSAGGAGGAGGGAGGGAAGGSGGLTFTAQLIGAGANNASTNFTATGAAGAWVDNGRTDGLGATQIQLTQGVPDTACTTRADRFDINFVGKPAAGLMISLTGGSWLGTTSPAQSGFLHHTESCGASTKDWIVADGGTIVIDSVSASGKTVRLHFDAVPLEPSPGFMGSNKASGTLSVSGNGAVSDVQGF